MGTVKAAGPLKMKWEPGCATNSDVVSCELRGKDRWSRYHAILKDGREIELRRVSNILELLETKALVQWAANEAAYHIQSQFVHLLPDDLAEAAGLKPVKDFDPDMTGDLRALLRVRDRNGMLTTEQQIDFARTFFRMCDQARFNNGRTRDLAADWGKQAHSWIERFLKYSYWPDEQEQADMPAPVFNSVKLFAEWWVEADLEVVPGAVELYVWDLDLGVGGTLDLQAIKKANGEMWVFDWKTGGLYKKGVLQMAAYVGCLFKAGYKIAGAVLCQVGRTDGIPQFRALTADQLRPAWNFFADLALNYETDHQIGAMCEKWNKEHKAANERRMTALQAEAAGDAGGHLDPKAFFSEFLKALKKEAIKLHAAMVDARIGQVTGEGFELLLPSGFGWHAQRMIEGRETIERIASRLSGIANYKFSVSLGGERFEAETAEAAPL